jgi:cephalosporin hydroxylase
MRSLDEIALSTRTDKSSIGHRYTHIYADLFDTKRLDVRNVCEIGVQRGRSIKMWDEYFTNAKITGVDISNRCLQHVQQSDKVKIIIHSATDKDIVPLLHSEAPSGFDIIIDDGSHKPKDQIDSFEILFPLLKNGGLYIVEDVYPESFGNDFLQYMKEKINNVFYWNKNDSYCNKFGDNANFYDRNIIDIIFYRFLIVIKKGDNTKSSC